MAQLIVRKLEAEIVRTLKLRAARNGRSAEAEHREILYQALRSSPTISLKEHLLAMPSVGNDEDFARRQDLGRSVDL